MNSENFFGASGIVHTWYPVGDLDHPNVSWTIQIYSLFLSLLTLPLSPLFLFLKSGRFKTPINGTQKLLVNRAVCEGRRTREQRSPPSISLTLGNWFHLQERRTRKQWIKIISFETT